MRHAILLALPLALLTFGIAPGFFAAPVQAATPSSCAPADDTAAVPSPLVHTAAVLKPGATLHILAIGSASVFGPEASLAPGSLTNQAIDGALSTSAPPAQVLRQPPSESSFAQQMASKLQAAVPGSSVTLTVRGGRGLTATDQLALLEGALAERKFALVLWQTGTIEAVRNLPPTEFATTLTDGVSKVEAAGADLVLIDPQYSRFLQTTSNVEAYEQAFQQVGSVPGVMLFHRYDLMRSWVNDGNIDLERTPKQDRKHAVEMLHACLGDQLARVILAGIRQ